MVKVGRTEKRITLYTPCDKGHDSLAHLGIWRRKKPDRLKVPSSLTHRLPFAGSEIPTIPGNILSFRRISIPVCQPKKKINREKSSTNRKREE